MRTAESTSRRSVRFLRLVGSALLAMLSVVVLPSEAWADSGSMAEFTQTAAGTSFASSQMTDITLTSDRRGIQSASFSRPTPAATPTVLQWFIYAYCGPDTGFVPVPDGYAYALSSSLTSEQTSWDRTGDGFTQQNGTVSVSGSTNTTLTWTGGSTGPLTVTNGTTTGGGPTGLCPTGQSIRMIRSWMNITVNGVNMKADTLYQRLGTAPTSSCASSFTSPRAGYANGTVSVRFGWSGTLPASAWRVHMPGSAWTPSTQANTAQASRNATITGTTDYGVDFALSYVPPSTAKLRISRGDDFTCFVIVSVTGGVVSENTANVGTSDTGAPCQTWDLFCQMGAALRSAFVPSSTTLDQWQSLADDAAQVIPFGYISDAVTGLTVLTASSCSSGLSCGDPITGLEWHVPLPLMDDLTVRPFDPDSVVIGWFVSHRSMLEPFAWAGVLFPLVGFVWSRAVPFINSGS